MTAVSALGFAYCAWIRWQVTLTHDHFWDAVIGVLLGIYICSRPATNLLDQLYTQRLSWRDLSKKAGRLWLVMNMVTGFIGWATIVVGAMQMVLPD